MSFIVKTKGKAFKKLEKFPKSIRRRIEELILILKENPLPYLKFDLVKWKDMRTHTESELEKLE
jgi:mRNA-degrading endonuclease RelE of RelBE toxin-antitoxin system